MTLFLLMANAVGIAVGVSVGVWAIAAAIRDRHEARASRSR